MSYSRRLIRPFPDRDLRCYFGAVDECRHDADLLGDELARSAAAGGAVEIERLDFLADERGALGGGRACRDAQANLVRISLTATATFCAA